MQLPEGKTIDVRDLDSLRPAFKRGESTCGVYRLHFENGEAYPGQSRNVVSRFASHRRTWPDIVAIDFFPMPADLLDEAEQFLITETEATHSVRNIMLTNKPRGNDTVEIVTSTGSTVTLPWERERAIGATQSYVEKIDPKVATLLRHPLFLELRSLVGWYIANTIQDPASTVEQLWTVSCMPSTNHTKTEHRLLTLSCGNLETLFIVASKTEDYEDDPHAFATVRINTAFIEGSDRFESPDGLWTVYDDVPYRGERVLSFDFNLGELRTIINGDLEFPYLDEMLKAAYTLNTRLMQRGSTMYSRFHSTKLADLLIAEAVTWD